MYLSIYLFYFFLKKKLGCTLAMWLGETEDVQHNQRRASYASFTKRGKPSQMEILAAWLEISLLRELEESCHFTPQTSYPQALRNLNSKNCNNKSDSLENGKTNTPTGTPLRRDNVECLFLRFVLLFILFKFLSLIYF